MSHGVGVGTEDKLNLVKYGQIMSDREIKKRGEKYCDAKKYHEAIQFYASAIQMNPSNPVYYTRSAFCAFKLKRFNDVVAECKRALELDSNLVKANFFMGQALCELDMMDDGVKHLQRAVDIAREKGLNYGDNLMKVLSHWRKRRFSIFEEKRLAVEVELQTYLAKLIREDGERQVAVLSSQFVKQGDITDETDLNEKIASIEKFSDSCMSEMNGIFAKADERRMKRKIPDVMCGKISFDILRDPVITPSGITYERKDIEKHLMHVGHFDPTTRVTLTADQLIPNYAMKEVVDTFVKENEWALDL